MHPSAKRYNRFILHLYDFWVLKLSNSFAWRCSTGKVLLPFFRQHIQNSDCHLDIGVGTGYYPSHLLPQLEKSGKNIRICLLDLNPNTLGFSSMRIRRAGFKGIIDQVEHDVFHPIPKRLHGQFETVSAFYLFHCLPGSFPNKMTSVLQNILPSLTPDGVFFGATVLGNFVKHNLFGRWLVRFYTSKGVFCNWEDSAEGLEDGLKEYFQDVEVRVVGRTALFVGRRPLSASCKPNSLTS